MESTGRFTNELHLLKSQSYDQCRSCGATLIKGVAAYAGYSSAGEPLYVGDCCVHLVDELASHIYWWWKFDNRCAPGTKIWRYMDFAKFVSILDNRSLYFSRADFLGDPFEGASGIAERKEVWDEFYMEFFRNAIRTVPGGRVPEPEKIEEDAARLLRDFSASREAERRRTFVSCWHANEGESEALWRLYCPPSVMGLAIHTDVAGLTDVLRNESNVEIGQVQYVDYKNSFAGVYDRIFWKRKSLNHENEVRAVLTRWDVVDEPGVAAPVNLDSLLHGVVASPFAPEWFAELIGKTAGRFGVNVEVQRSELLSDPFF